MKKKAKPLAKDIKAPAKAAVAAEAKKKPMKKGKC